MTLRELRQKFEGSGGERVLELVERALEIWSQDAALGYMLAAAEREDMGDQAIRLMVSNMLELMDMMMLEEAAEVYRRSEY